MTVGVAFLHNLPRGTIVIDPVHTKLGIELWPETGGEKPVTKESARRIQDKDRELGFRNGKAMRPCGFRQPAHHRIDIFNIVDKRAIGMSQAIVDG